MDKIFKNEKIRKWILEWQVHQILFYKTLMWVYVISLSKKFPGLCSNEAYSFSQSSNMMS